MISGWGNVKFKELPFVVLKHYSVVCFITMKSPWFPSKGKAIFAKPSERKEKGDNSEKKGKSKTKVERKNIQREKKKKTM